MVFVREWDDTCPREYDRWESDGATWVIVDLPPEDDAEAMDLMRDYFLKEETLAAASGVTDDPETLLSLSELGLMAMSQRMSLACYEERNGVRKLAGLNLCVVACKDDDPDAFDIQAKAWQNVQNAYKMASKDFDFFEHLGTDKLLRGFGLLVKPEYRGKGLAPKILLARTPLCKNVGIKACTTYFTSAVSQKNAERTGFTTVFTFSFKDLAGFGLNYPPDENVVIKAMVKKFE